jgi:hypothetical protein
MNKVYDPKTGRLVWEWDDTVTPHVYRMYDPEDGVTVILERPFNAEEIANFNQSILLGKAGQALDVNKAFLALTNPTQLQSLQQIQALTRQMSTIIRLMTANLAVINDT